MVSRAFDSWRIFISDRACRAGAEEEAAIDSGSHGVERGRPHDGVQELPVDDATDAEQDRTTLRHGARPLMGL